MLLQEKDRLMLINQYEILSLLNPSDKKYYLEKILILQGGFEGMYENLYENLSAEILNTDETNFVLEVLEMYGTGMILSYKNLSTTTLKDADLFFPGFNSNEEMRFFRFAQFVIEDLDRFREIEAINKGNYRGISDNIPKYKKMLIRWNEMGKYNLTEEMIKELISIN